MISNRSWQLQDFLNFLLWRLTCPKNTFQVPSLHFSSPSVGNHLHSRKFLIRTKHPTLSSSHKGPGLVSQNGPQKSESDWLSEKRTEGVPTPLSS